ncbi:MAG: hypothetical protein IID46_07035 [Planctomycetes bacterium]|nr:hypothetical protein [Planctomycetota bacterium]
MKDFRRTLNDIRDSWTETDSYLASRELKARTSGRREYWQRLRHINNQSHFLTMHASFEDYVNRTLEKCFSKQTMTGKTWTRRRAWEVLKPRKIRTMSFKKKIALLTQKGHSDYNSINDYYKTRNNIAHGQFSDVLPLVIPDVYDDFLKVAQSFTI